MCPLHLISTPAKITYEPPRILGEAPGRKAPEHASQPESRREILPEGLARSFESYFQLSESLSPIPDQNERRPEVRVRVRRVRIALELDFLRARNECVAAAAAAPAA